MMPDPGGAPETDDPIIALLVGQGLLDSPAVSRVRHAHAAAGRHIDETLVELGLITEERLASLLAEHLNVERFRPDVTQKVLPTDASLNPRFLVAARVLPLEATEATLRLAVVDPFDSEVLDAMSIATARSLEIVIATRTEIAGAQLDRYALTFDGGDDLEFGPAGDRSDLDIVRLQESQSDAPAIRFVSDILARAVRRRASDIHFEPMMDRLRVRMRLDGVLTDIESIPQNLAQAVVSRLKVISGLDIAEARLPQDGAARVSIRGQAVDIRISTLPSNHGEAAVVRILDRDRVPLELEALGYSGQPLERIRTLLRRPNGLLLMTGPTGSGKTTTLYAMLRLLNDGQRKIITVEDPIEYEIAGITQIQVNGAIGLTFARALRSILRHDPDIVLLGEIRDGETAKIAIQAALTGHLVLSTLHTNSAAAAFTRLADMGVEDYLIASTVIGVGAQRLVRKRCTACSSAPPGNQAGDTRPADGCVECRGTGFKGRTALAEVIVVDEAVRRLITGRSDAQEIEERLVESGLETMAANGRRLIEQGVTTSEEIARVTLDHD